MRVVADNDEELQLFLYGIKEFGELNFSTTEEEEERRLTDVLPPPQALPQQEEQPKHKKIKILENRILKPASSATVSPTEFITIYDDDADNYESQKFTVL